MFKRRGLSSSYLGVGVGIATGVIVNFQFLPEARAQDLNLQTQMNITAPPPVIAAPNTEILSTDFRTANFVTLNGSCKSVTSEEVRQVAIDVDRSRSSLGQIEAAAARKKGAPVAKSVFPRDMSDQEKMEFLRQNPDKIREILSPRVAAAKNEAEATIFTIGPNNIKFGCGSQPAVVKVSLILNPTAESNVLKMGNNSSQGLSAGFGSNVLATVAGLRPLDLVALSAGEGSSRYNPFPASSNDTTTALIAYQYFLSAEGYVNGKMVPINDKTINPPAGTLITTNTVQFGVLNQSSYTPTFHNEKADIITPQVTFSSQNIRLGDPSAPICGSIQQQPNGPPVDNRSFCYFANVSLTVGESLSDVPKQENFNIAASVSPGWRIDDSLTLSLPTTVTARDYQQVVGGRRDLQVQVGPLLAYTPPSKLFTFTLPVSYYKNYSTLTAAAWSGFVIQPTLTISFSPPAIPAMPHS